MADICPNCSNATVQHGLGSGYCLTCGEKIIYGPDGSLTIESTVVAAPQTMSDSSLATPTATPVYAEQASDRQPVLDTNQEPVPSDVERGPTTLPAPDVEAANVAGELSDETPEEKTSGGPTDQPRTADLTDAGEPTAGTLVDHSADEQVTAPDLTEEQVQARNEADSAAAQADAPAEPAAPADPAAPEGVQS